MSNENLKPLEHQVAGHPSSVLTSSSGEWILKPSLPLELEFYATTAPTHFPTLVEREFIPKYYGSQIHNISPKEGKVKIEQAIKLENLTHGYSHPNVLDIKLGTQLYDPLDDNLTPDKQARMEQESAKTTSGSDGVRLTGFTVYDSSSSSYVSTPKQYGKSIPSSELVNGIRRFFPCSSESHSVHATHPLTPDPPSGLAPPTLSTILKGILSSVQEIYSITREYEWRVYGGSLLIVYEGDEAADSKGRFTVKLIDFAHARYLQSQGPDEGQNKGFETVIRLLETRLEEITELK